MANDILISISEEPDATLHILGEYIGSAYSPQIEVAETQTGHDVAITYDDADEGITTTTFSVEDGEDGADGFSPTLSSSAITGGHRVSMTDATGTETFDVMDGLDGADGYSPSAKVMQGDGSATITITDKDGTTTAAVQDGADGTDGFSPTAIVTQTASGATISITDKSGTTTASVSNGTDGTDGTDGADGFSPTVDVQEIEGGHEVTITDAQGPHSFDVMDGDPAAAGSITDEMLAPDGIKTEVEWLWGNQLKGTLTGDLLTASDAYAAPPMALTVDGRSTQAGTPTPDAPVPIVSVDEPTLAFAGKNLLNHATCTANKFLWYDGSLGASAGWYATDYINAAANTTYTLTGNTATSATAKFCFYDNGKTVIDSMNAEVSNRTFTTPDGTAYIRLSIKTTDISTCQLELGDVATAYEPYTEPITVPLYDGPLRSLPDGTKDELHLTYLRPSTREGWAWYSRELVQRIDKHTFNGSENWSGGNSVAYNGATGTNRYNTQIANLRRAPTVAMRDCLMSDVLMHTSTNIWSTPDNFIWYTVVNDKQVHIVFDNATIGVTAETGQADRTTAIKAWLAENPITIDYPLATPITTQLDPIELPVLPAPTCTIWADPTTGLTMEYVRDTNIVIASLQAALADLATS